MIVQHTKRVRLSAMALAMIALATLTALVLQGCGSVVAGDSSATPEATVGPRAHFIQEGNAQRTGVYDAVSGPRFGDVLWENKEVHVDHSQVIAAGEVGIFPLSRDKLGVADLGTGKVLYTLSSPQQGVPGMPYIPSISTVAAGVLYYQGSEGLHAWDLAGKKDLWVYKAGFVGHSPVVQDGVVYFGASESGSTDGTGFLVALDAATGMERWRFKAGYVSYPAIGGGMVYFRGGETLWQGDFGQPNSTLYAVDLRTGNLVWKREPSGTRTPESYGNPVYYEGLVYAPLSSNSSTGSGAGQLYALDARTGAEVWKQSGDILKWTPEVIAASDGTIYLTVQVSGIYRAYIHAFDAKSGEKRWTFEAGSRLWAPSIASGNIYLSGTLFGEVRGVLYSLDPRTGTLLDKKEFDANLTGNPAVANGVVYLPGVIRETQEQLVMAVQTLNVTAP